MNDRLQRDIHQASLALTLSGSTENAGRENDGPQPAALLEVQAVNAEIARLYCTSPIPSSIIRSIQRSSLHLLFDALVINKLTRVCW